MAYKFVCLEKDKNNKFRIGSNSNAFHDTAFKKSSRPMLRRFFTRKEDIMEHGTSSEVSSYKQIVKSFVPDSSYLYLQTLDKVYSSFK